MALCGGSVIQAPGLETKLHMMISTRDLLILRQKQLRG